MAGDAPARPVRVAVAGAGICGEELMNLAEAVGRRVAEAGGILICGGLGGVMEGAARGAALAGGTTVGILPGSDPRNANPYITVPLPTAMGEGRNVLVARTADALIAIGGEWGTLSEVALARKVDLPVVLLRPGLTGGLDLPVATSAEEAVRLALDADRWVAEDKIRHLGLSFAATAFGYGAARFATGAEEARALAAGGALALGVAKELLDSRGGGPFSGRDLAWDAVGVALGFLLIRSTN